MTDSDDELQKQYPGLGLAYELAVDSYDPLIKRLDSIDGRLQTIMGFAATTMAVVPSVANARNLSFRSIWFWLAFATLALIIGVGSYARHHGEIKMLNRLSSMTIKLGLNGSRDNSSQTLSTGQVSTLTTTTTC